MTTRPPNDPLDCLAVKVLNLRQALEMANQLLVEHNCYQLKCDEDAPPTFAEVRKLKESVTP